MARANWDLFRWWLAVKPAIRWSCVERGTGLFQNFDTKADLYIAIFSSPAFRGVEDQLKHIEFYHGKGIIAVDKTCFKHVARKYRNGNIKVKPYMDDFGGLVIHGDRINFDLEEARAVYDKYLESKNDKLSKQPESSGDITPGCESTTSGGDELPAEVSGSSCCDESSSGSDTTCCESSDS